MNSKKYSVSEDNSDGGKDGVHLWTLTYPTESNDSNGEPITSGEDVRTVAFGTSGDPDGKPLVFFSPLGASGSRRMVAAFHEMACSAGFKIICANRPGCGATTESTVLTAESHVRTTCSDIIAVLDSMQIERTEIMFMCAGTPFALAFAALHQDRMVQDKAMIGIAGFVPPADCDLTKPLFRFGARYSPVSLVSWILGGSADSALRNLTGMITKENVIYHMAKTLSPKELEKLKQRYETEGGEESNFDQRFFDEFLWIISEGGRRSTTSDLKTVLTSFQEYIDILNKQQPKPHISLFHGLNDKLTSIEAAEWLSHQLPCTRFISLEDGTHEGTLFMLHPELENIFTQQ